MIKLGNILYIVTNLSEYLCYTCGVKIFNERQSSLFPLGGCGHPKLLLVFCWTSSIGYGAFGIGGYKTDCCVSIFFSIVF